MATPPVPTGNPPRPRVFGKVRFAAVVVLLALLGLCGFFMWLTRGAVSTLAFLRAHRNAANETLVDLGPWQTAQTLASLAVTSEEIEYAREAEHLADHEVDQAFAAALRQADLQTRRRTLTGPALQISQRITLLRQEIVQDSAAVNQLKAQPGNNNPSEPSDALQVAQAQLDLDTDELADAQHDLQRVSGDQSVRIQQELAAHEASMKQYDSGQQKIGQAAVVSVHSHGALIGRLRAWFDQRSRYASLQQAQAEAENGVRSITAEHNALDAKASAPAAAALTLDQLENRRTEREILSIDDDRIQTDQQLAEIYDKWGDQVLLQHGLLLHLILSSAGLVLAIVIGMLLGDALVRQLFEHPRLDYRQTQILRTIFEVGVQVVGVLLIALVLFGPPKQTATAIGLVSAALTISLQDYILAFFGWFILVGRNGVRVGDMIEVNGVCGEVIDIGLMSTTLLETSSISSQNQLTGRRVSFLNSFAIRGQFFNFSSKGQWLWDDMTITVPADKDFYALASAIEKIARDETEESARIAEKEWNATIRRSGLGHLSADPVLMLLPASPGIAIQLRYVTSATNRLKIRDHINRKVIELLQQKPHPTEPAAVTA
ncbi:MAG: mechanosensitive ion channel domain-containing protein [Acidobacteriota bacterium]